MIDSAQQQTNDHERRTDWFSSFSRVRTTRPTPNIEIQCGDSPENEQSAITEMKFCQSNQDDNLAYLNVIYESVIHRVLLVECHEPSK